MLRRRDWATRLVAWAQDVRGRPYVWGETDCASLVRAAWEAQFGVDVLADLPRWVTDEQARKVWGGLPGGVAAYLAARGAVMVPPRRRGVWPNGTLLLMQVRDEDAALPALAVVVGPIVVQSDRSVGVQWADPTAPGFDVAAAWLLEQAVIDG